MLSHIRRHLLLFMVLFLGFSSGLLNSSPASAHVKWFGAYDVAGQPRGLESVLGYDFKVLVGLALFVLTAACVLEATAVGAAVQRALDRVTFPLATNADFLLRAICGFFFVALWTTGGIILTPELRTDSPGISWLQLAIAAGMLWRGTLPIAALGIAILFGLALRDYGIFHLLDYPLFIGIAAYFALTGLQWSFFGMRPIDLVRWATAITLMWASIEKWAYPEWSFPLFVNHPSLLMGFGDEFFMRAAGVIEFALSFALLWTPLVRRLSAIVLAAMFVSAIVEFGKLDAIGHAPIVAVLLVLMGDNARAPIPTRKWSPALAAPSFATALAIFLFFYYELHATLFGTSVM